jgi:hypothetical protein
MKKAGTPRNNIKLILNNHDKNLHRIGVKSVRQQFDYYMYTNISKQIKDVISPIVCGMRHVLLVPVVKKLVEGARLKNALVHCICEGDIKWIRNEYMKRLTSSNSSTDEDWRGIFNLLSNMYQSGKYNKMFTYIEVDPSVTRALHHYANILKDYTISFDSKRKVLYVIMNILCNIRNENYTLIGFLKSGFLHEQIKNLREATNVEFATTLVKFLVCFLCGVNLGRFGSGLIQQVVKYPQITTLVQPLETIYKSVRNRLT